jgi:predicted GNAT family N-acyltransferase
VTLHLRPYRESDREACLGIFESNVPTFFAPSEAADFAEFLEDEVDENYFVVEDEATQLVGCGGVFLRGDCAGFCWGMVEHNRHRRGIGTFLLVARLEHLRRSYPHVSTVQLDTSQHSRGFFARFGFVTTRVTPNAYAPGLDRVDMVLHLGVLTNTRQT